MPDAPERARLTSTDMGVLATPRAPWGYLLMAACVVALAVLVPLELFWRHNGYSATMLDDVDLWSYHRQRLEGAGRETVALVGASRMQFGFVPEAFGEQHPDVELVQLAISGEAALTTLRDVVDEQSFRGTVIFSLAELTMLPGWDGQQAFVDYYHTQWSPGKEASLLLATFLQERLVLLQPRLRGSKLLNSLWDLRLPPVNYIQVRFDRMRIADYTLLSEKNVEGLINLRIRRSRSFLPETPPASMEMWRTFVADLTDCVARIDARGGRVVLVKFPLSGQFKALTDEFFPRAQYWDSLAAGVRLAGGLVFHYEDMKGADNLRLPDESHLDGPSAVAFTRWLGHEFAERGIL